MDKRIGIFEKFKYSVNPNKYMYFLKERIINALVYLLIICIIAGGIQGVFLVTAFSESEKILKDTLETSEMKFQFTNGILNLEGNQWIDEHGENLILINTEKNISQMDDLRNITIHKTNVVAFLRDGFMIKTRDNKKTYTYDEVGLGNESFDNYSAEKYLEYMDVGKYLLLPYVVVIKYIGNLISALCIMLIGIALSIINKLNLKYSTIFIFSIYSLTIPNIIGIIFPIGSIDILISSIIISLAFIKIKKDNIL